MLSKIISYVERHEPGRFFLTIPVLLAMGITGFFALSYEPSLQQTRGLVPMLLLLAFLTRFTRKSPLFLMAMMLMIIAIGFWAAQYRVWYKAAPMVVDSIGPVMTYGTITDIAQKEHGVRLTLGDLDMWKIPQPQTPKTISIVVRTQMDEGLKPGDRVKVRTVVEAFQRPKYPGGYDRARAAFFREQGGTGFAVSPVEILEKKDTEPIMARLRHAVSENVYSHTPKETAAVIMALLAGQRSAIDRDTNEVLRASGLAHLLAISGLHLVLVTGFFFFAVRYGLACIPRVVLFANTKKIASVAAMAAGLFYLLLVDSPISAQRAYIMVSIFFLAVLVNRMGTPLRPVAIAAIIILLIMPEALFTASFQMSFAAATALIAGYEWLVKIMPMKKHDHGLIKRLGIYLLGVMATSLIAGMATAPLIMYHFGRASNYGILANLVAVPLTSFVIMPSAIFSLILMPIGLEALPLKLMAFSVETLIEWAGWITSLPKSTYLVSKFSVFSIVAIMMGGLWLCIWQSKIRLWGIGIIIVGILLAQINIKPDILIDEESKLFAFKQANGEYVFSSRVAKRGTRNEWQRMLGQTHTPKLSEEMEKNEAIHCMNQQYYIDVKGKRFLFARAEASTDTDCDVDMVINMKSDTILCEGTPHITASDLHQKGAHGLHISSDKIHIKTVEGERGERLWTQPHRS